jgi:hypothetical protein
MPLTIKQVGFVKQPSSFFDRAALPGRNTATQEMAAAAPGSKLGTHGLIRRDAAEREAKQ